MLAGVGLCFALAKCGGYVLVLVLRSHCYFVWGFVLVLGSVWFGLGVWSGLVWLCFGWSLGWSLFFFFFLHSYPEGLRARGGGGWANLYFPFYFPSFPRGLVVEEDMVVKEDLVVEEVLVVLVVVENLVTMEVLVVAREAASGLHQSINSSCIKLISFSSSAWRESALCHVMSFELLQS